MYETRFKPTVIQRIDVYVVKDDDKMNEAGNGSMRQFHVDVMMTNPGNPLVMNVKLPTWTNLVQPGQSTRRASGEHSD